MTVSDDVPAELQLNPRAVSVYLAASGWLMSRANEVAQYWEIPEGRDQTATLMLPLDNTYSDFGQRFNETLRRLCLVHDWSVEQLATHVLGARSDFLFIRANQSSVDGSIPLPQAESMLQGAHELMLSAASSAISAKSQFRGRRTDAAKAFVNDDVRMGHTQRGSFIITILTRLREDDVVREHVIDEPRALSDQDSDLDVGASLDLAAAQALEVSQIDVPPFQRRVMESLAYGLAAAREISTQTADYTLDAAVQRGLSSNLVDAIGSMTNFEGLHSLDLSFEWAPAGPSDHPNVDAVVIDRDIMPLLSSLKTRLESRPVEPTVATIFGLVTRLERGEDDNEGIATISGIIGRSTRRHVSVSLTGKTYNQAITAHRGRMGVSVTGLLETRGRRQWLSGDVIFETTHRPAT